MATQKVIKTRVINKHDTEANWLKAVNFVPWQSELIIYDKEVDANGNTLELPEGRQEPYTYERFKIGDGITNVNELPFATNPITEIDSTAVVHGAGKFPLSVLLERYMLNIDYENVLAFNTEEIVLDVTSTTSVLGQAILGQMVLA
jgi:hypothetical protein